MNAMDNSELKWKMKIMPTNGRTFKFHYQKAEGEETHPLSYTDENGMVHVVNVKVVPMR